MASLCSVHGNIEHRNFWMRALQRECLFMYSEFPYIGSSQLDQIGDSFIQCVNYSLRVLVFLDEEIHIVSTDWSQLQTIYIPHEFSYPRPCLGPVWSCEECWPGWDGIYLVVERYPSFILSRVLSNRCFEKVVLQKMVEIIVDLILKHCSWIDLS